MAFTYTWKVTGLKIRDEVNSEGATLPNAVVQTYWELTGTDENGNSATFSGATPFTAADVPEAEFTAFDQLTEENVLGWIKNEVNTNPHYKQHIDEQLQKRIDEENLTELTTSDLPWSTAAVTPTPEDEGIA